MDDTSQQDRLIAELLDAVIDLTPEARREHLAQATDDAHVIERILQLVEGEQREHPILDAPLLTTRDFSMDELQTRAEQIKEPILRTIGHFTLEEVLGEGGMGRVYLAYQNQPVQRQVALKVMRHGLSSSADEARFDSERQSLARLSHPNIAQMFEAGATDDGKLYFAMELVRGLPITRYCDRNILTVRQRLHVFMDVLLAVQHAHQRQLLHRDLKPSNILVTDIDHVPIVKVIDFGISLGIDEEAGQARQQGQRAGTPGYSSPESLEPGGGELGLDTRSDIYTLGIVLYELVCGARPFDQPGDSINEVWRKICEDTPLSPAQQLSRMDTNRALDVAKARGTRPARLMKQLNGDLSAIIAKAIARDREERYGSVAAFFDDLQHVLDHEPVAARTQDFTYVAGLAMQRHLGLVLAGSMLVIAMVVGLVAWSGEAHRANMEAARASNEAQQANEALAESRELSAFLVNLFSLTGERSGTPERMTMSEILALGAGNLEAMDQTNPLAAARLRHLLGEVYTELYMLDEAETMALEALETRRLQLGPQSPSVADSLGLLGNVYQIQMRYEDAEPLLREALNIAEGAQPQNLSVIADAWFRLGTLYWNQERLDEAINAHERALEIREVQLGGQDRVSLAESLSNLGIMLMSQGRFAEAEPYFSQAVQIYAELPGSNNLKTAAILNNLATVEENIGQLSDAEAHYRAAYDLWSEIDGPTHSRPVTALESLARALGRWGRYREGVIAGEQALSLRKQANGPDHPDVAKALIALAVNQTNAGDLQEARENLLEALKITQDTMGPSHQQTEAVRDAMGWYAWQTENYVEAERLHAELLNSRLNRYGPNHSLTAFSRHNLALAKASLGQYEAAQELMAQALQTWDVSRGPGHRTTAHSLHYMGLIEWNLDNNAGALGALNRAALVRNHLYPPEHPDVMRTRNAVEAFKRGDEPFAVTPQH